MCQEICNCYSSCFTVFLAQLTSNTSNCTDVHQSFSFIIRIALYKCLLFVWNKFNQFFWTCSNTFSTCLTFFFIYHCNSIYNMDCVKWTCLHTVSKSKASIITAFRSGILHHIDHDAVSHSMIFILILCFLASSCTFYKCCHSLLSVC